MSNIILHQFGSVLVGLNKKTGFINITALAKAYGLKTGKKKQPADWLKTERARLQIKEVSKNTGIPIEEIIVTVVGNHEDAGTWVHPDLTVLFDRWLNSTISNKTSDYLYIIGDVERNVCKIGITNNIKKRFRAIQTAYPWELEILHCVMIFNAREMEKYLHQKFADFRLKGEWFDANVINLIDWNELVSNVPLANLTPPTNRSGRDANLVS